ncbi:MAG: TatD family hydrolase [Verrucomicrobia bacterium]|nr:TatD family hydrolase [Verrucomicrobiota bacterium]
MHDPQARFAWLVERARQRPHLPDALRLDRHRVSGCQVRLWWVAEVRNGRCEFQSDSDAVTLRAMAGLWCDLASGASPEELAAWRPDLFERFGLLRSLADNRRTTVLRIGELIREFARSHCGIAGLTDAHNHLQDSRFGGYQDAVVSAALAAGVSRMVVNGSCESDWPEVAELARRFPAVVPAFGLHPWSLAERTPGWETSLNSWLDRTPVAVIGEIGLDRWIHENPDRWRALSGVAGDPPPMEEQESLFLSQLQIAAERGISASIHCLRAFGRLLELLANHPRPERGFLLHSYGGPTELVPDFVRLGAYFSFPGYFGHERKARAREVFRAVPQDRLLLETDAPDQLPPEAWIRHPLRDPASGAAINHPANLPAIAEGLATILGVPIPELTALTAANFRRLFG